MKFQSTYFAATLLLALSAAAQTRFCIAGDLDQLTAAEVQACRKTSNTLRSAAQETHVPANWSVITVCDEAGWQTIASLHGAGAARLLRVNQTTDQTRHITFVRATHLQPGDVATAKSLLATTAQELTKGTEPLPAPATVAPVLTATRLQMPAWRQP